MPEGLKHLSPNPGRAGGRKCIIHKVPMHPPMPASSKHLKGRQCVPGSVRSAGDTTKTKKQRVKWTTHNMCSMLSSCSQFSEEGSNINRALHCVMVNTSRRQASAVAQGAGAMSFTKERRQMSIPGSGPSSCCWTLSYRLSQCPRASRTVSSCGPSYWSPRNPCPFLAPKQVIRSMSHY